jgi:Spy/CpxP family protein refolding chaperone
VKLLLALAVLWTAVIGVLTLALPRSHGGGHSGVPLPYAGQEGRAPSTLSADDVAALLAGQGWGLAKAAELNGYPGPLHVLELADALELTPAQRESVQASSDRMKARAQELGVLYIQAEKALDDVFKSGTADVGNLSELVAHAEKLRAELRMTHLGAHLETAARLRPEQRQRYMQLRGYSGGAPHAHRGP